MIRWNAEADIFAIMAPSSDFEVSRIAFQVADRLADSDDDDEDDEDNNKEEVNRKGIRRLGKAQYRTDKELFGGDDWFML